MINLKNYIIFKYLYLFVPPVIKEFRYHEITRMGNNKDVDVPNPLPVPLLRIEGESRG